MNTCKEFLKVYRKIVGAKPEEKIDKRIKTGDWYLAPNNKQYKGHCGYCAEVGYLGEIYGDKEVEE